LHGEVGSLLHRFNPGVDILRQVLIYPSVDYTLDSTSVETRAEGYWITTALIVWFFDNYFRHGENRYEVSPLYGEFTAK
jgi:acetyl esterase/lipase